MPRPEHVQAQGSKADGIPLAVEDPRTVAKILRVDPVAVAQVLDQVVPYTTSDGRLLISIAQVKRLVEGKKKEPAP
jgi:hypothetical protein